jgi:hypothetical protein
MEVGSSFHHFGRFFLNGDVGDQIVADLEMQGFAMVDEKAVRHVFAVHIPLVRLLDYLSFPNESQPTIARE